MVVLAINVVLEWVRLMESSSYIQCTQTVIGTSHVVLYYIQK